MTAINATYKNGQIVLDGLPDWPEGCRVRVEPVATDSGDERNDQQTETPEQIEDWLRWYHALEPLEFTPQEEADLAAWRQKVKDHEMAQSQRRLEELFP
jgi:hypothetical protein